MFLWAVLCGGVAVLGYIRLAPSDVSRWHLPVVAESDKNMKGGVIRVRDGAPEALVQIDRFARGLERTQVLAGSVSEGRVTYITRSRLFGFPDYTTVEQQGGVIRIHARLRFGRSDFGVNGARVRQLLSVLQ